MKSVIKKATALCLILMLLCLFVPFAYGADNGQQLLVKYDKDGVYISGAKINLYRIGTYTPQKILPENDFALFEADFEITDTEKLSNLALTLEPYALKNKLTPDYTDTTDEKGEADFGQAEIRQGAYLVTVSKAEIDGVTYLSAPVIIALPYENHDVVTLEVKSEAVKPDADFLNLKAIKVWKNDREDMRSDSITVELLKDGSVYDTRALSKENGWHTDWSELDPSSRWSIIEKDVPTNYTVIVSLEGITFVVTNDAHLPDDEPITEETTTNVIGPNSPGGPDYNTTTDVSEPDNHGRPDHNRPGRPDKDKLPDTGTNLWMVPYIAIAGTLLLLAGYVRLRKGEQADEQ